MSSELRILYVNATMHCSLATGVQLRVFNIGRLLRRLGRVTMVCVNGRVDEEALAAARREFEQVVVMAPTPRRKLHPLAAKYRDKFVYHWPGIYEERVSADDRKKFSQLQREHDLVWFHSLAAADRLGCGVVADSVMDIDDLNHVKYGLKAQTAGGLRQRWSDRVMSFKWRRRELAAAKRFSRLAVCSGADKERLGGEKQIHVIGNGFNPPTEKPSGRGPGQMRLGFIGELRYEPNLDSLVWFRDHVWPLIVEKAPDAKFRIVGRMPKNSSFLQHPGFKYLGYVEDVEDEFATWSAMVVPLRIGGGTRVKILESFSRMCPIVSTPTGAYGLEVTHGENILLASDPEGFAKECIDLLGSIALGGYLAEAAWDLYKRKYTWEVIGQAVGELVQDCLDDKKDRR